MGSGQILLLLTAWAVAQWPFIVYPDIDLHTAAAPAATLTFAHATLLLGMGLVLPSLWLLFAVFPKGHLARLCSSPPGRISSP